MKISNQSSLVYTGLLTLVLAIAVNSSPLSAQEKPTDAAALASSNTTATASALKESPADVPDISEIISLAARLSGRLKSLKIKVDSIPDLSNIEDEFISIEKRLNVITNQMAVLSNKEHYQYHDLIDIRSLIELNNVEYDDIVLPLNKAIRRFDSLKKEWQVEKEQWTAWQASLLKDGAHSQLTSIFVKAHATIDTGLVVVLPQFEELLAAQMGAGNIKERIYSLDAEVNVLISTWRRSLLLVKSYPMFSSRYISQLTPELWYATLVNIYEAFWLDQPFFGKAGWIAFLQGIITFFMIIAIYRNKQVFTEIKPWKFLGEAPIAAGIISGMLLTAGLYEYLGIPLLWRVINIVVFGICLVRLLGNLFKESWKKRIYYWLIIVYVIMRYLLLFHLPSPLFRLSIVLTALGSLIFFWVWIKDCRRFRDRNTYTRLLRLGFVFFVVIIIAEILGKEGLPEYVFICVIHSIGIVLGFLLLMRIIRGTLEWLFRYSPLKQVTTQWQDLDSLIGQLSFFINFLLWVVFTAYLLLVWGYFRSFETAIKGILTFGIDLNVMRISVRTLLLFVSIIYSIYFVSCILQKLFIDKEFARRKVELGVQIAIRRLINYLIIVIAFFLAFSMFGFGLTNLTIIISALGVGIGFGLQGVVNNFVSGLILLFERPIRIGDTIEIDGQWGEIKEIGLRSTVVQSFDQSDMIIPNADLITTKVTNWTLSSRQVRSTIPVGVAYGSDVTLVMEILLACAHEITLVSALPEPQVLFRRFGESSLEFELRIWIIDASYRMKVISDLHQEIDKRFREANIEIAFPQHDLHLRSVDSSIISHLPEPKK